MERAPHNRTITAADEDAAGRLRKIWAEKARLLGVTQDKVAELLDGTQGLVSQYLNAKIALNYKALLAFAQALEFDPREVRSDLVEQQLAPTSQDERLRIETMLRIIKTAEDSELGLTKEGLLAAHEKVTASRLIPLDERSIRRGKTDGADERRGTGTVENPRRKGGARKK